MFRSHSLMSTGLKMTQQVTHQTVDMKSEAVNVLFIATLPFLLQKADAQLQNLV